MTKMQSKLQCTSYKRFGCTGAPWLLSLMQLNYSDPHSEIRKAGTSEQGTHRLTPIPSEVSLVDTNLLPPPVWY